MKGNALLFSLFFCLLVLSGCGGGSGQTDVKQTAPPRPEFAQAGSVAVWDLENLSVVADPLLADIGEFLVARVEEVFRDGGYTVVEREKLYLALEELNLGSSGLADQSTQLELGKIIGAGRMVFGAFQKIGDQIRIDLRLIDVATGGLIRAAEKSGAAADVGGLLDVAGEAALELL